MYQIVGNSSYGDKIERALFNAGGTAWSHDCKKHVYYQSANSLKLTGRVDNRHEYRELHDPLCCTGNITRFIPNYVLHMWMATSDNGVAATMYGPSLVSVKVGNSIPVKIEETTSYPFDETITLTIKTAQSVEFPLHLRIPKWCKSPVIKAKGQAVDVKLNELGFVVIAREWKDNDQVAITFPMEINCVTGITKSNGSRSSVDTTESLTAGLPYSFIERGPLLFTLMITGENTKYNYGIITSQKGFTFKKSPLPQKFSWGNVTLSITLKAQPIDWPVCPKLAKQTIPKSGKTEDITLVPYGCSQGLRITMFPVVK